MPARFEIHHFILERERNLAAVSRTRLVVAHE